MRPNQDDPKPVDQRPRAEAKANSSAEPTPLTARGAGDCARLPEDLYRELFEKSLGLISTHDLAGRLLTINPAIAAQLGYAPEEIIGRNLREFLAPSARPRFDDYLRRSREEQSHSGVMRLVTKQGEERVWAYHNIRRDEPGRDPYVLGHAHALFRGNTTTDSLDFRHGRGRHAE